MTVFITGDRALNRLSAVLTAAQALPGEVEKYASSPEGIFTGDLQGFEAGVRYLWPQITVVKSTPTDEGKPDLDARHAVASLMADFVIFVHPDPFDSRIYQSVAKFWAPENISVVSFV